MTNKNGVLYLLSFGSTTAGRNIEATSTEYGDHIYMEVLAPTKDKVYKIAGNRDVKAYYMLLSDRTTYGVPEWGKGFIKFSRVDSIAAGVFEFTASTIDGRQVKITDGYFDITMN